MKIAVFVNSLGLGGTEKAACRWAQGLQERGHCVWVLTLNDGPRRFELTQADIPVRILPKSAEAILSELRERRPDVIHAHAPGHRHEGDILGHALEHLPKIPVIQTNVFGRLDNPTEDRWVDFRVFISWTSCVQAARRSFRPIDADFFRRASVAVYPLDPDDGPTQTEITEFRYSKGITPGDILCGRLSRPEPNKWTDLPIEAFRIALRKNDRLKLLLREPPAEVACKLKTSEDHERFVILAATSDRNELHRTMAALDIVLHASSIGESFGYGIAEPMNFGKPVIANSTPWQDQAQIELVRHRECGFIASTPRSMADAILRLAEDAELRKRFGHNSQRHIRQISDPGESLDRLERILKAVKNGRGNPRIDEDMKRAAGTASYLDAHQFGHSIQERLALAPFYYRVRFNEWRRMVLRRIFQSP